MHLVDAETCGDLGETADCARARRYDREMNKPATPDEVLEELRGMSFEEREYVRAELMREDYESGRLDEAPEIRDEIIRRAKHALAHPGEGHSLEETVAAARAVVAAVRERKSGE